MIFLFKKNGQTVKWLWPGRLPHGEVSLLEGQPGTNRHLMILISCSHDNVVDYGPRGPPPHVAGD